ncbi:acyl-CoA N-acyltransferase [Flagelloscypha sp. PMI_526]|nr:acyl-CoA N-acyltransferase [Flagelloscypha sp. PMI_526]
MEHRPSYQRIVRQMTQELVDNSLFHAMLQVTETGEVVGWITSGLDGARNRSGRLGIVIKQEHWRRGYAQEAVEGLLDYAFDNLGYHRMGLNVYAGNTRAIKLYEKIGFKEEGRIREVLYCNGLWEDSIEMGMLKKEWKVIRQTKTNLGTIS